MPTMQTVEVIKVTEDVYTQRAAVQLFKREVEVGAYLPMIHAAHSVYCICRIPHGRDDAIFIEQMKSTARRNRRVSSGVEMVPVSQLFTVIDDNLVRFKL